MASNSHSFDVDEAKLYGVEKAIILYNFRFWLKKNKANGTNVREKNGVFYHWTFNSAKALTELFPYFRLTSVKRWLNELEADGVIISGVFNKVHFDRTKWYTMPEFISIAQNGLSNNSDDPFINEDAVQPEKTLINPIAQNGPSTAQNGLSEGAKMGYQIAQNGPTIPDGNPDVKKDGEKKSKPSPNRLPEVPCNDFCKDNPRKCKFHNRVGEYVKISDPSKIDDLDWANVIWILEKTGVHTEAIEELRIKYSDWLKTNPTKANKVKDLLLGFKNWIENDKKWNRVPWKVQQNGQVFPEGEFSSDIEVITIKGFGKARTEYSIPLKQHWDNIAKEMAERDKEIVLTYKPLKIPQNEKNT
jgi:hypothetical protein